MSSPALTVSAPRSVPTKLFGTIVIDSDQVVRTDDGVLGFPACREWVLLDGAAPGTAWLQSVEHPPLAFLLADPFEAVPRFVMDLAPAEMERLQVTATSQVVVFAIVTLPTHAAASATANLAAPIVINVTERCASQVIMSDGRWGVRTPITLPAVA